jgi:hypothetical protein
MEQRRKKFWGAAVFILTLATFSLGVFSSKIFLRRNENVLLTEGFNFQALRSSENAWRGPDVGFKIDLTRLKTQDGRTLASSVGQRPIMISTVHPDCGLCRTANDEMIQLRDELKKREINYYISYFAWKPPQLDFFKYSDSLNIGVPAYLWNAEDGPPPESVFTMTVPSHMLLNSDGTVIRVWPGSYNDKHVRQRMALQILADTAVIADTFAALHKLD